MRRRCGCPSLPLVAGINVICPTANLLAQQLASKLAAANQGGAPGGGYPPPGQGQGAPGAYVSLLDCLHALRSSRAVLTVSLAAWAATVPSVPRRSAATTGKRFFFTASHAPSSSPAVLHHLCATWFCVNCFATCSLFALACRLDSSLGPSHYHSFRALPPATQHRSALPLPWHTTAASSRTTKRLTTDISPPWRQDNHPFRRPIPQLPHIRSRRSPRPILLHPPSHPTAHNRPILSHSLVTTGRRRRRPRGSRSRRIRASRTNNINSSPMVNNSSPMVNNSSPMVNNNSPMDNNSSSLMDSNNPTDRINMASNRPLDTPMSVTSYTPCVYGHLHNSPGGGVLA
jgi:hypothetical protein